MYAFTLPLFAGGWRVVLAQRMHFAQTKMLNEVQGGVVGLRRHGKVRNHSTVCVWAFHGDI